MASRLSITCLLTAFSVITAGSACAQNLSGERLVSEQAFGPPISISDRHSEGPVQPAGFRDDRGDYPEPIASPELGGVSTVHPHWETGNCPTCSGRRSPWTDSALRRPDDPRWYIGGMVGVAARDDEAANSADTTLLIDYDNNVGAGGTVGYLFKTTERLQARLEGEFLHRHNGIETVNITNNQLGNRIPQAEGGESSTFTAMANLVVDVSTDYWNRSPLNRRLVPYIGLGVGLVHIDQDIRFSGNRMDDEDTVFGGQALVGLSYRIKRDWEMFVDGRFLWAADPDFTTTINGRSETFKSEYQSATVMFGMRFYFDNLPGFGPLWEHAAGRGSHSAFRPDIVIPGRPR